MDAYRPFRRTLRRSLAVWSSLPGPNTTSARYFSQPQRIGGNCRQFSASGGGTAEPCFLSGLQALVVCFVVRKVLSVPGLRGVSTLTYRLPSSAHRGPRGTSREGWAIGRSRAPRVHRPCHRTNLILAGFMDPIWMMSHASLNTRTRTDQGREIGSAKPRSRHPSACRCFAAPR